jgi:DNA-binding HxlR family transcriptional regulator
MSLELRRDTEPRSFPPLRVVPELPDEPTEPHHEPTEWEMVEGTRLVVGLLSSRWRVGVLYLLAGGTKRFSEVFYEVGEVSKKVLTQTLRGLERDGLVTRRAYAEVPVRVEYSLTRLGWSITGVLMGMYEWASAHQELVAEARLRAEDDAEPQDERLAA